MKFRTYGMILTLFFALGLVFSFSADAPASHGDGMGITAQDVDPTSEQNVRDFLDHIIDYYDQVVADNADDDAALNREVIIYGRQIRQEGVYNYGNIYSMGINESGIVTNHAGHPDLFGHQFVPDAQGSAVASTIESLIASSTVDVAECKIYGAQNRAACAIKVESPSGVVTTIAGLHHEANDPAFKLPDCSGFELATTAEDVYEDPTDANLVAYVKSGIGVVQQQMADAVEAQLAEFLAGGGNLGDLSDQDSAAAKAFTIKVSQRIYDKAACFGSGDFKHENIYAFVMDANPDVSTVLFNGNNFDLNGTNLELEDDQLPGDDKSIAGLFNRALGDPVIGATAYVNYHWDDPTTTEDDVPDFFENKKVPGTSCKRSYIEVADVSGMIQTSPIQQPYIFGSGTYHGDDVCVYDDVDDDVDDDGGCAVAGTGHTFQSALLNLFLIASVLFSVVSLRKRG